MRFFSIIVSLLCVGGLFGIEIKLSDLPKYGEALNIEGGVIPRFRLTEKQLWANLCFVLDRPLHDQKDLDEITDANSYPLKESSISEFNEPETLLATALTLKFYVENTHSITQMDDDEKATLMVQIHRNKSGPPHLERIVSIIEDLLPELELKKESGDKHQAIYVSEKNQCTVKLCHGYDAASLVDFEGADLVLSISLAAGLDPELKSGTILLPARFMPFDVNSHVLAKGATFEARNHLLESIDRVLDGQSETLVQQINERFLSPNPKKKDLLARELLDADFRRVTIIQASGLFYPKKMYPLLELI